MYFKLLILIYTRRLLAACPHNFPSLGRSTTYGHSSAFSRSPLPRFGESSSAAGLTRAAGPGASDARSLAGWKDVTSPAPGAVHAGCWAAGRACTERGLRGAGRRRRRQSPIGARLCRRSHRRRRSRRRHRRRPRRAAAAEPPPPPPPLFVVLVCCRRSEMEGRSGAALGSALVALVLSALLSPGSAQFVIRGEYTCASVNVRCRDVLVGV